MVTGYSGTPAPALTGKRAFLISGIYISIILYSNNPIRRFSFFIRSSLPVFCHPGCRNASHFRNLMARDGSET